MSVLRYFITSKAKRSVLRLFLSHIDSAFYTREVARLTGEPLNAVRRELGYMEKAGLLSSYMQGNLKYYKVVKTFPVLAQWQKIILFTPNVDNQPPLPIPEMEEKPGSVTTLQPAEEAVLDEEVIEEIEEAELAGEESSDTGIVSETAGGSARKTDIITTSTVADILHNEFQPINLINLAIVHGAAALSDAIPEEGIDLLVVGDISSENLMELLSGIEDDTRVPINVVRMTRSDFEYRNAKGDPLIRRIWSEKKLVVKGRH